MQTPIVRKLVGWMTRYGSVISPVCFGQGGSTTTGATSPEMSPTTAKACFPSLARPIVLKNLDTIQPPNLVSDDRLLHICRHKLPAGIRSL